MNSPPPLLTSTARNKIQDEPLHTLQPHYYALCICTPNSLPQPEVEEEGHDPGDDSVRPQARGLGRHVGNGCLVQVRELVVDL